MKMSEEAAQMSGGAASRFLVVPLPPPYKIASYVGYVTPTTDNLHKSNVTCYCDYRLTRSRQTNHF